LDAFDAQIAGLLHESTIRVGTHERGIPEVELVAHGGMTRREANDVLKRVLVIEEAPVVGEALAAGELSAGHVDAISRAMKIAGDAKDTFLGLLPGLVEAGSVMSVPEFAVEVTRAAKGVVTDGGLSTFEDQRRSTYLKIWNDATGMVNVRSMFDPEIGAILQSRVNSQVEVMFHSGDREVPVVHHTHVDANDFRRAHALVALVTDHEDCARPGGRGSAGREEKLGHDGMSAGRVTPRPGGSCRSDVVVHIDLETLTNGLSASSTHRTAFGADLPVETIRRIACDANIIPLVLNGAGMPLDIGRGQRLASAAQRTRSHPRHVRLRGVCRGVPCLPDPPHRRATRLADRPRQPKFVNTWCPCVRGIITLPTKAAGHSHSNPGHAHSLPNRHRDPTDCLTRSRPRPDQLHPNPLPESTSTHYLAQTNFA
jgi:hypothetical protein